MPEPRGATFADKPPSGESATIRNEPTPPSVTGAIGAAGSKAPISTEEPGRYVLGVELGHGGQSVVHIAYDAHLGRQVAFKQIAHQSREQPADSLSPAEARFVREARVTAQLDHPGIAPIHEVGRRADGSLYVTQKLVRGMMLSAALERCRSAGDRLRLLQPFLGVCQAVAYAHARGVIHRDLKPANVMLGELGEAVVLDWGIARTREAAPETPHQAPIQSLLDSDAGRTREGSVMGTPHYMSPEQAVGATEQVDARTDVWSLGVVLYELLAGRKPFDGASTQEVLRAVATAPLAPVRSVAPDAPPELAAIAERALTRDPAHRYPSAQELAADVAAWLSGERVVAHDYTSLELARRFVARNRTLVSITAALLVAAVVAAAALLARYRAQERGLAEALLERSRTAAQQLRWNEAAIFAAGARLHEDSPEARWAAAQTGPAEITLLAQWQLPYRQWHSLLLAPDGSAFVHANVSVPVRVDVASGKASLIGTTRAVGCLAFSADGSLLAACDDQKDLFVTSVADGKLRWKQHRDALRGDPSFSPDGRSLAIVGADGRITLLDTADGSERKTLGPYSTAVAFSPDGRSLVSVGAEVAVWDAETGARQATFAVDADAAWFLPDGRIEWAGKASAGIRDVVAPTSPLRGWSATAPAIPCRGNGNLVVAQVADDAVLWDLRVRGPLARLPGGALASFSADCRTLLTVDGQGVARVFRIGETTQRAIGLPGHAGTLVVFTARGDLVWVDSFEQKRVLRIEALTLGREIGSTGIDLSENGIRGSADGALLAAQYFDARLAQPRIRVRSIPDLQPRADIGGRGFAFTADPHLLGTVSTKGVVRLWDARTGKLEREIATGALPGNTSGELDFSPDGRRVAITDGNGLYVWDLASSSAVGWLQARGPERIWFGGFSTADRLYAVDHDGFASTLAAGGEAGRPFAHAKLRLVDVSRDRSVLVLADGDRMTLWNPERGEHLLDVPLAAVPNDCAVSSDGRTLAVVGEDPAVLVIPLRSPLSGVSPREELARRLQTPTRKLEGTSIADAALDLPNLYPSTPESAPVNPGFEEGEPGKPPPGWRNGAGTATISTERPFAGTRCALLEAPTAARAGVSAVLSQGIDARGLRGKKIRLRGAVRAEVAGLARAQMWLRVDRPGGRMSFLENMDESPIRSPDWHSYELEGRVAPDAERVAFGVLLIGEGKAWFDDISLSVVD